MTEASKMYPGDKVREALAQLPASQLQADALECLADMEREMRRGAALTFAVKAGMVNQETSER